MKNKILLIISSILVVMLTASIIKGRKVDLENRQSEKDTSPGGPYESTNSTSRYALTEVISEQNSFFLNDQLARFSAPDIVKYHNRYFSIFTPGISFISVPFYQLGKIFGYPQILTYLSTTFFALINVFLIAKLARILGSSNLASYISGFVFLFATNALAYSNTLTQHHAGTALIVGSLILGLGKSNFINKFILGVLVGFGLLVDVPNVLFSIPILLYVFISDIKFNEVSPINRIGKLLVQYLGLSVGFLIFLAVFGWYNFQLTGSYFKVPQFIGRVSEREFSTDIILPGSQKEAEPEEDGGFSFPYEPRDLPRGLSVLLLSSERGWFYYSPVLVLGVLGLILFSKKENNSKKTNVLLSTVLIIIVSYSMFGDPWGGWSFGPRYLIPATAIVCSLTGLVIDRYYKKLWFTILFFCLFIVSNYISSIGALTSNAIPPKHEAESPLIGLPYTYRLGQNMLTRNQSSSLVYNLKLNSYISAWQFQWVFMLISTLSLGLLYYGLFSKEKINVKK
jgi:hypothetical protein